MTGRRLYDLVCDAAATTSQWEREREAYQLPVVPRAWPFLTRAERSVWNAAAKRATPRRRSA